MKLRNKSIEKGSLNGVTGGIEEQKQWVDEVTAICPKCHSVQFISGSDYEARCSCGYRWDFRTENGTNPY